MKLFRSQQSALSNQQLAVSSLKSNGTAGLMIKCVLFFVSIISVISVVTAQPDSITAIKPSPVEMATGLRSSGKIYVVVIVLLIILSGIVTYLIRLDRKITRLEKEGNN